MGIRLFCGIRNCIALYQRLSSCEPDMYQGTFMVCI